MTTRLAAALLLVFVLPASARAQDAPEDPFATARFRFGPLALTPSIALSNLGVDGNVYNAWQNPESDFTFTVTPQADAWLRFGPGRVTMRGNYSYVFFATHPTERSGNTADSLRLEVPLLRFRPFAGLEFFDRRERPGYEVDARVRHNETSIVGGVDLLLTRKVTFGLAVRRAVTDYETGETFRGEQLRDYFNRTTRTLTASARYALTPLTTLTMDIEHVRERFDFSPLRNSDGYRIVPGVQFEPMALISGSARVGVRRLDMVDPTMPDYTGLVASLDLGYTLLGTWRFGLVANRDVAYSYQVDQPYYLLTGATLTVTRRLTTVWDLQARGGLQSLAYQSRSAASVASRTDSVRLFGGGVGYRLGPDLRLGFNVDYQTRSSPNTDREYRGLRAGTSLSYGF